MDDYYFDDDDEITRYDELIEEATSSHGVLGLKAESMKRSLADWHKLPLIFL